MRYVLYTLVLCLPLRAGDSRIDLAAAVAKFGSDYTDVRDAGTHEVRRFLQTELAPLLAAMKAQDPEVSRRARRALAVLLPGESGRTSGQAEQQGPVIIFNQGGRRGRMVLQQFWVGGRMQVRVVNTQKEFEKLQKFGLEGMAAADGTLRKQLGLAAGRGFIALKVLPDTPAAAIGLEAHDIVVRIDDTPVMEMKRFVAALGEPSTWKNRKMRVFRAGRVVALPPR